MSSPPNPIPPSTPLPLSDLFKRISYKFDDVSPPWPLYTQTDDVLEVDVINSNATVTIVAITARWMRVDGQLITSQQEFTMGSARVFQGFSMPVMEGFLLAARLTVRGGTNFRGQCWAQLLLNRPQVGTFPLNAITLVRDYLVAFQGIGYPGGRVVASTESTGFIRTITGTTPGLGAEITETVPTGARWRLQVLSATLVTSAAVATRAPHLIIDDGANILFEITANGTQAASLTQRYSAGNTMFSIISDAAVVQIPLSEAIILQPGWRIRTLTGAIQAGDQYSAPQYSVEEWINT